MKRLIIGAIAAITVGLVAPAPSGASPITHSEYVTAIQQWGWIIDSDSAIRTGHSICASGDAGRPPEGVCTNRTSRTNRTDWHFCTLWDLCT